VKTTTVFLTDLAERVLSTFLQVFLATILSETVKVMWGDAAAIALFAAFASFLTTTLVWMGALKLIENPYVDLVYRAVITFGQTLLGYVTAAGLISALSFNWSMALKMSLVAAGVSLLKGLIGLNNSRTLGASPVVLRIKGDERPMPYKRKLPLVA